MRLQHKMTDLDSSSSVRRLLNDRNPDTSNNKFAFLVHSQDTLPNNLPPNVDDKPLARQKRRRTRYVAPFILKAHSTRYSYAMRTACSLARFQTRTRS
jgi:hypothetical protein